MSLDVYFQKCVNNLKQLRASGQDYQDTAVEEDMFVPPFTRRLESVDDLLEELNCPNEFHCLRKVYSWASVAMQYLYDSDAAFQAYKNLQEIWLKKKSWLADVTATSSDKPTYPANITQSEHESLEVEILQAELAIAKELYQHPKATWFGQSMGLVFFGEQ